MKVESGGARPVYAVIYAGLREKIFRGELNPGDLLPSESDLCNQYNVSRETVRKGLEQLKNEGLIISRPKRGYFVNNPNHDEFIMTFSEELENCWSKYKDVRGILPEEEIQDALRISADKKVIEFSRVTYDGEFPVAFDIKYVPYDKAYPTVESEIRFAVLPEIAAAKVTPFDFYTKMEVRAVNAKGKVSEALECEDGEPLLLIARYFIQQDGRRLGYSKYYARQPHGKLQGISGNIYR